MSNTDLIMKRILISCCLALLVTTCLSAQSTSGMPAQPAASLPEQNVTPPKFDDGREAARQEVNAQQARLDSLVAEIKRLYADDKPFLAALNASQKKWSAYCASVIDMQFPHEDIVGEYGSAYFIVAPLITADLIKARIKQLSQWTEGYEEGECGTGSIKRREELAELRAKQQSDMPVVAFKMPASPAEPLVQMGDVIEIPSTPSRIGPQPPPAHRMKIAIGDQLISNDTRSIIVSLPPALVGAEWIQMPKAPWNFYATFKLTAGADAYFAFSENLKPEPIPSHWIATGEKIKTSIESYDLYRVSLPVNTPILLCDGVLSEGGALNPSIIIFKPRPADKKGAG